MRKLRGHLRPLVILALLGFFAVLPGQLPRGGTGGGTYNSGVFPITSTAANLTLTAANYTVLVDTTAGNVTILLQASPSTGRIFNVKKTATVNTLTISGNGVNIDGTPTVAITSLNQDTSVQFFAGAWYIL